MVVGRIDTHAQKKQQHQKKEDHGNQHSGAATITHPDNLSIREGRGYKQMKCGWSDISYYWRDDSLEKLHIVRKRIHFRTQHLGCGLTWNRIIVRLVRQEDVSFDVWDKGRDRFEGGSGREWPIEKCGGLQQSLGVGNEKRRVSCPFLGFALTNNATRCGSGQRFTRIH